MSVKKLSIFLFSFFLTLEVNANVKIEKKFKLWESQYVESAEGKVCFAVSMPTKMTPSNLNRAESRIFVTSVIIGATKMNQLELNLKSHEINLDDEVIKDINKVQEIYSNPCP